MEAESSRHRPVLIWLIVLYAMVLLMVVIGGITRLTGSGLSMVEWHPLMGALPPIGDEAWQAVFAQYQESPQYQQVNHWMTLSDFKTIFFWEYFHRLFGRLIGLAFVLPWLFFLLRGRLRDGLAGRTAIAFALGGAQGILGWYMVKSGLVDVPAVSHYRLAAHFMLAMLVGHYLLWLILDLASRRAAVTPANPLILRYGWGLVALTSVQLTWGAFMAGTRAGSLFSTFPDMNDAFVPPGMWQLTPLWRNLLDNPIHIHFTHRLLGWVLAFACLFAWLLIRKVAVTPRQVWAGRLLLALPLLQMVLGAATVMSYVSTPMAVAHQLGGVLVLSAAVFAVHTFAGRAPVRSPGG